MITGGSFKTAGDLQSYLKNMFEDALQEILEAELEVELGYSKGDKKNVSVNYNPPFKDEDVLII